MRQMQTEYPSLQQCKPSIIVQWDILIFIFPWEDCSNALKFSWNSRTRAHIDLNSYNLPFQLEVYFLCSEIELAFRIAARAQSTQRHPHPKHSSFKLAPFFLNVGIYMTLCNKFQGILNWRKRKVQQFLPDLRGKLFQLPSHDNITFAFCLHPR